ncbi:MAG: oligosaccharide flippase family protein, partial [bacterium]|nr:oligosaccharide flippase family protein [bacterium]
MSNAKSVSSNTAWQIASKIINGLSGLIIISLIARNFDQTIVGYYTLILSYIGFYFIPVDFGLNAIAVKHLLDNNHNQAKVFKNLLGVRLFIGTIATIFASVIAYLLPYNTLSNTGYSDTVKIGILAISFTILAQAILATTNAYFQAHQNYKLSFLANAFSALSNTLIVVFLINQNQPFLTILGSFTISGFLGALVALLLVYKNLKSIAPLFEKNYWKELITQTLPLTTSLIINLIYF